MRDDVRSSKREKGKSESSSEPRVPSSGKKRATSGDRGSTSGAHKIRKRSSKKSGKAKSTSLSTGRHRRAASGERRRSSRSSSEVEEYAEYEGLDSSTDTARSSSVSLRSVDIRDAGPVSARPRSRHPIPSDRTTGLVYREHENRKRVNCKD